MEPALDLPDVLTALGDRVAPISLARERTLPLPSGLSDLFPEGGLVRGRTVRCSGPSATSLALSLVAPAVAEGCWLALIDLPTIGLDAAGEYGVPLERIVHIDTGDHSDHGDHIDTGDHGGAADDAASRWPDVVAAAADGFEILLVSVPADVPPAIMRKVTTRVQQRGAVVVVLGEPGPLVCDAELRVDSAVWNGVGAGDGHLHHRTVTIRSGGRRIPTRCRRELLLPGRD